MGGRLFDRSFLPRSVGRPYHCIALNGEDPARLA